LTDADADVVIVGGGPAGCATALALRSHAPSLSVTLIEASTYAEPRLGETLPPIGRTLLEHLGVWEKFRADGHQPLYGTAAAWGAPVAREHPFICSPHGAGWHLDRGAFDASLANAAAARGVTLLRSTRVTDVNTLRARFLVDATGRTATLARRLGARMVGDDRLVAFTQLFEQRNSAEPRTLVEAFRDGWWYTARVPGVRPPTAATSGTSAMRSSITWPITGATRWSRLTLRRST